MLILAPIDQTGCLRATSGVALAISSRVAVRNGPPDAVSTIFSTARAVAVLQRLEDRVVLGVHRQQRGAGVAHGAQHHFAGADQRLLVGQRDRRRRG